MTARRALRERTATAHERVDALFARCDLSTIAGYRDFLGAQAGAFLSAEAAIDGADGARLIADWPERRRGALLRADLAALDVAPPDTAGLTLADDAAVLGAIYVLEGSRLGGAMLRRALPPAAPNAFLSAAQPAGSWRKLLDEIDALLYEPGRVELAVAGAGAVFALFEREGRRKFRSVSA